MASAKNKLGIETVANIWCHSARSIRFLGLNGLAVVPLLVFLFHMKVWTFILLILVLTAMTIAERKGYSPGVAMLALRAKLSGKRVSHIRRVGRRRIWAR